MSRISSIFFDLLEEFYRVKNFVVKFVYCPFLNWYENINKMLIASAKGKENQAVR